MCFVAQIIIINLTEFNTRVFIDSTCAVFPPPQLQLLSARVVLKIVSSLEFHKQCTDIEKNISRRKPWTSDPADSLVRKGGDVTVEGQTEEGRSQYNTKQEKQWQMEQSEKQSTTEEKLEEL